MDKQKISVARVSSLETFYQKKKISYLIMNLKVVVCTHVLKSKPITTFHCILTQKIQKMVGVRQKSVLKNFDF